MLSEAAILRAVDALRVCRAKMRNRGVTRSRLIATEACRSAGNGLDFLERIRSEVGIELEIVDRETEARLAATGCTPLVDPAAEGVILFDIGGGSSELVRLEPLLADAARPAASRDRGLDLDPLASCEVRKSFEATIASAALLVVVSTVTVWLLRAQLTDNLDEGLIGRADEIAMLLAADPAPELPRNEDVLIQVLAPDGTVRQASASVQGMAPITSAHVGVRTVDDVPGRPERFRVVARTVDTPRGPATLLVGVNDDDVSDPVRILSRVLAGAVPLVVASLAALTWWLTGRTLRPVERMRRELAEITAGHRGRRVAEPGTADEVDRLARTMNETLDRLDAAITRQTRFVADASHELRSPLTRIRTELEVDLVTPGSREEIERSVLQDVVSLQHLVDDLLQLARSDEGVAPLRLERVDLDDIVLKEARRAVERGRVDVDVSAVAAAQTIGDPRHLTRVVRNLLDNAERHARRTVTLSLDEDTTATRLVVVDDGAGIPPGDREHIFERFARADQARSRDAGGSGLGLAIARDIVERHGGTITLADGAPTTFVVELAPAP